MCDEGIKRVVPFSSRNDSIKENGPKKGRILKVSSLSALAKIELSLKDSFYDDVAANIKNGRIEIDVVKNRFIIELI